MNQYNQIKVLFKKGMITAFFASFILFFGVSCGKKGPLYIPKEKQPVEQKTEADKTIDNNADTSQQEQK